VDRRTFLKAIPLAAALPNLAYAGLEPAKLIVHEWGTFTTIAGEDGFALEWLPLEEQKDDLPSFVYRIQEIERRMRDAPPSRGKGSISGTVRMETPVLYFYADREMEVDVAVGFPGGKITEWYPAACHVGAVIHWGRVQILPNARPELLREAAPSHYYPARDVDASIIRAGKEHKYEYERFLFYRGVGTSKLPVRVQLSGDTSSRVEVSGAGERSILFDSRDGKIGWRELCGDGVYERPTLSKSADVRDLLAIMRSMLLAKGLYTREADAMLATWRDTWFVDGLRLFWLVPSETTDAILPLYLSPAPKEVVRVLVGRVELDRKSNQPA
jgi:hypothetical protein